MAKKQRVFKSVKDKAKWVSDFLGIDLETVTEPTAFKLLMEYHMLLYGEKKLGQPLFDAATGKKVGVARISGFDGDAFTILKQAQEVIRNFLEGLISLKKKEYSEIQLNYRIKAEGSSTWLEIMDAEGEANLLKLATHEVVSQLGLDRIQRCENEPCQNLFINVRNEVKTKRKKRYCSQRCASQQTVRIRRQGQKEKEARAEAKRKRYGWNKKGKE
jgi:hypothetical protein